MRNIFVLSNLLVLLAWMPAALGQAYPSKPIHVIVPYAAGGASDGLARVLAAQLTEAFAQPVLIENRPGGSAIIGMSACSKASPDGYTICQTVADSVSYNPYLIKNLPYDPLTDFIPVINLVRSNSMLLAKANAPFNSFKEMIAYAKVNPGVLNWGTWGAASIPDVYLQWIRHQTGVNITPVTYKGSGPSVQAVLAGEIDVTFQSIGTVMPHIKSGRVKPVAAIGAMRSPLLPDMPTLAEEGVDPGLRSYFGVFAPAKTPKAVIDRLNAEYAKALQSARVQDYIRAQSMDVVGGSAAEFADFIRSDVTNAGRVFRAIGLRPGDAPL